MSEEYEEYEENVEIGEDGEEYEEKEYEYEEKSSENRIDLGPAFRQFAGDKNSFAKIHYGNPMVNNVALSTFIGDRFSELQKTQQRIAKASRTDEEIFGEALLVCALLANQSEKSIKGLFDLIPKFKKLKYKNPLLMMIAYLSIDREKKEINMELIQNTLNSEFVKKGQDTYIRDVDVIRYIRYLLPYLGINNIDDICSGKNKLTNKKEL